MNEKFSVVIVCKNEVDIIETVVKSATAVSDDVVVYDNGSTDGTIEVLCNHHVQLHQGEWMGFGRTKQFSVNLAKYDWILSIDADEVLDNDLQNNLRQIIFKEDTVYQIDFKNFFGVKCLKWGEWGGDRHVRLFNRQSVRWDEESVHEKLVIPRQFKVEKLKGNILHYTVKDTVEYTSKVVKYAMLNAEKYFAQGKKAPWVKRYINPRFSFIKNYILRLGFLDGWEGLVSARMTAFYTFLKYARLHELWLREKGRRSK